MYFIQAFIQVDINLCLEIGRFKITKSFRFFEIKVLSFRARAWPRLAYKHKVLWTEKKTMTLADKHLMWSSKFRSTCIIFLLNTYTFNLTAAAILYSGFVTSDDIFFFVLVSRLKNDDKQIPKFSALNKFSSFIFHANIIFTYTSLLGIYCYVCLTNSSRLHIKNPSEFKSNKDMLVVSQKLNGNWCGRHVLIQSAIRVISTALKCVSKYKTAIKKVRHFI